MHSMSRSLNSNRVAVLSVVLRMVIQAKRGIKLVFRLTITTQQVRYEVYSATGAIGDEASFRILLNYYPKPCIIFLKQNVSGKSGKTINAKNTSFATARPSFALAA